MAKTLLVVLVALVFVCVVSAHGHGGHAGGRSSWRKAFMDRYQRVCADDAKRVCPDAEAPEDPRQVTQLFDTECFKGAESLSNECQQMITDWRNWVASHDKPQTSNNDDDDDDDDKAEKPGSNEGEEGEGDDGEQQVGGSEDYEGAQGTPFYESCHNDRMTMCPDLPDNVSPHDFVNAKCFNHHSLTKTCKKYMEKWIALRGARMAAFGILISTTLCLVGGLLACLTLVCCVACCVRRRRVVMLRRCAQKKAAAKAKAIESEQPFTAVAPVYTEAVDASLVAGSEPVVMVADMENAFPMQTFPAGSAYSPYSYPANWQPVYFAPSTYTPVPQSEQ